MAGKEAARKPRGEVAELSASLQNLCTAGKRTDKELRAAKKEVFKKVINYMTLGMDMSSLFPSMTSCANLSADDLILKKMCVRTALSLAPVSKCMWDGNKRL